MIDTATADILIPPARRSHRTRWIVAAAVILVLAAGAITAVQVSLHYLHATPLSTNGGGWDPPDSMHAQDVEAGPYTASVIRPRYGQAQTFELTLTNPSSVSQTVLGMTHARTLADPRATGEPETLQISARDVIRHPEAGFTSKPVTIAPGGQYSLRFTTVTGDRALWRCGRSESYQGLDLRVRVGAFTRTEHLDFGNLILEIRSPDCP